MVDELSTDTAQTSKRLARLNSSPFCGELAIGIVEAADLIMWTERGALLRSR